MTSVSARAHGRKIQRQKDPRRRSLSDSGGSASASIVGSAPADLVNMEEAARNKRNVSNILTDNILFLVLSRLSARTLCICKCVYHSWNLLISQPEFRKELPQIVAGFFLCNRANIRFASIFGECPSSFFLPCPMDNSFFSDSCNGLILFVWVTATGGCYVVYNPMTRKYVVLPQKQDFSGLARLEFDPTVSSHFHVVELRLSSKAYVADIYSSKTGAWIHKESEWVENTVLMPFYGSVFVSGFMLLMALNHYIVVIDMAGKTWRKLAMLGGYPFSMNEDKCRFCLCTANWNNFDVSIWILEDYGANKWTLKHTVQTQVFGTSVSFGLRIVNVMDSLNVIAVYLEWNLIFLSEYHDRTTLMAYDMSYRKVHVLPARVESYEDTYIAYNVPRCMPYVPLFMESLAEK